MTNKERWIEFSEVTKAVIIGCFGMILMTLLFTLASISTLHGLTAGLVLSGVLCIIATVIKVISYFAGKI